MAPVDVDVGFVAEDRRGDLGHHAAVRAALLAAPLQGPARIAILLGELPGLRGPALRNAAALDDLALLVSHPLTRRGDDGRIHDLATHRQVAGVLQMRIEPGEEPFHGPRLDQSLPEPPDRRLVRDPVTILDPEEPPEGPPRCGILLGADESEFWAA